MILSIPRQTHLAALVALRSAADSLKHAAGPNAIRLRREYEEAYETLASAGHASTLAGAEVEGLSMFLRPQAG